LSKIDLLRDQKFIFGSIQVVANKKETLLERELKEFDITFKQWFLTVVIENTFDTPPTIKETAKATGSSHQNVKQIGLKLAQKGFVILEKDKKDSRVTRIRLTEKCYKFSEIIQAKATSFTTALYAGIDEDEMSKARVVLQKMLSNLAIMEQNAQEN